MRPDDSSSKPNGAVLDAPEEIYAPAPTAARRRSRQPDSASRRDFGDDFAAGLPDADDDAGPYNRRPRGGYRLRFEGNVLQVPRTLWGRIAGGVGFLCVAGCMAAAFLATRSFFLHDARFVIESSSSIQTVGNTHLTRAQLLSVFGEDVERNIFNVPLAERRTELECLPWVQHATVMRLLPNHLRIAIIERTPVAFVRQGTQIGMVDASGVLLDMPSDAPGDPHYSFPVITGISADDPISTRAARMKIYADFTSDLDSSGNHISEKLSEVDLSNPEDVKALIPEGSADILVHFGDTDFLSRYQKFEQHLAEWRTQYPKLASVDMRYERQVVLEMQSGSAKPPAEDASSSNAPSQSGGAIGSGSAPAAKPVVRAAAKAPVKSAQKTVPAHAATPATQPAAAGQWHMTVVKPHPKAPLAAKPKPAATTYPTQAVPQ